MPWPTPIPTTRPVPALETIHTQAEGMAALLAQLLLLARADKGRQPIQWEPVDLSELAAMVAETEAEQAAVHDITVQTDLSRGDGGRGRNPAHAVAHQSEPKTPSGTAARAVTSG